MNNIVDFEKAKKDSKKKKIEQEKIRKNNTKVIKRIKKERRFNVWLFYIALIAISAIFVLISNIL